MKNINVLEKFGEYKDFGKVCDFLAFFNIRTVLVVYDLETTGIAYNWRRVGKRVSFSPKDCIYI